MDEVGMQKNEFISDETNFWEFFENVRSDWRLIVSSGMLGLLGSVAFLTSFPFKYEASALLQPAAVGTAAPIVEPIGNTIERLKTETLYSEELIKTCQVASAKDLLEAMKVKIVKGTNLIAISYRGDSSATAQACIEKVVEQITQSQSEIAAPLVEELEDQMAFTKKQIEGAERFLLQLEDRLNRSPASNSSDSVLLMLKREELGKLQKVYREQRVGLTEPLTQPMKLLEPIYASRDALSPKPSLTAVSGLIAGLLVGLIALFLNRSWHRYADPKILAKKADDHRGSRLDQPEPPRAL
jgi:uncharacterized protein involved in exopolysaccharide biosynthesis